VDSPLDFASVSALKSPAERLLRRIKDELLAANTTLDTKDNLVCYINDVKEEIEEYFEEE